MARFTEALFPAAHHVVSLTTELGISAAYKLQLALIFKNDA